MLLQKDAAMRAATMMARPTRPPGSLMRGYLCTARAMNGEDRYMMAVVVVEIAATPAGSLLKGSCVL